MASDTEEKKDAAINAVDAAKDAQKEGQEASGLIMPALGNGAAQFFDTNTKAFWVGIPVDKVDPLMAAFALDRSKFDYAQHYIALQQQQKLVRPSGWQNIKNKVSGLFRK